MSEETVAEQSTKEEHKEEPMENKPVDDEAAKKAKKKEEEKKKKKAKEAAKKEKEKKEKDAKTKKKPNISIIKEALKKQQEEEERLKREEEEKEARLLALQKEKEEKALKEQERKEREKQKKKDRIARQKREGTYMTAEQKQKQRRQLEALQQLKEAGLLEQGGDKGSSGAKPSQKELRKQKKQKTDEKESSEEAPALETDDAKNEDANGQEENGLEEEQEEEFVDDWEAIESESEKEDEDATVENGPGTQENKAESAEQDSGEEEVEEEQVEEEAAEKSDSEEEIPRGSETKEQTRERIKTRIKKRQEAALTKRSNDDLRSPVICVLGHVDTGKTKMLDKIRSTHVQDGEAGGITQQIGATMVPGYAIKQQCKMVKEFNPDRLKIPGFLIIDTPGHESFRNLRSRGSSLCDIAILIVDIMHGLEPQTLESIQLLTKRKTPFVIALNKIDRLYEWKSNMNKDIRALLKSQQQNCQLEFQERVVQVKTEFAQEGLNVALYWENPDPSEYISMVPTSAFMGDGVGNLMAYIAQFAQERLDERLAFSQHLDCTVLEVKALPGLGTTIDVILVNGTLHYGDTVVVAGTEGPIVTQIRELLMPQPLKEMRVKNPYEHFKEIRGAQGVKVLAKDFDKALAGLPLLVARKEDEVEILREDVALSLKNTLQSIRLADRGVYVQASTLGSLEALLEFLRTQKIPYCGINIGPVHKKDVMKASTMLEHDSQWAVILAFDVKIEREGQQMADELGVRIFAADIIYHLQDSFVQYREELRLKKRREHEHLAIFPCKLRCLAQHVYKTRDPIILGVSVESGILKVGTPLCVPSKECLYIGSVSSIEANKKPLELAKQGTEVCIKIENTTGEAPKMFGRHFDHEDLLVSRISRETIDVCKQYFRDDLGKPDWQLMVELKKLLGIL